MKKFIIAINILGILNISAAILVFFIPRIFSASNMIEAEFYLFGLFICSMIVCFLCAVLYWWHKND